MKYSEQLKDPRWLLVREKVYENARYRCQLCGVTAEWLRGRNQSLQAHHSYYESQKMAWDYPMSSMVALCDECHSRIPHRDTVVQKAVSAAVARANSEVDALQATLQYQSAKIGSSAMQAHVQGQYLAYAIAVSCGGKLELPVRELDISVGNYLLSSTFDEVSNSIVLDARPIYDGAYAFGIRVSSRSDDAGILEQILDFVKLLNYENLQSSVQEVFHDSNVNSIVIKLVNCVEDDEVARQIFSHAYRTFENFEWFGTTQGKSL